MDTVEIWEWAWRQLNKSLGSIPDCEHNRSWRSYHDECRKIQLAMQILGRQEDMPVKAKKKVAVKQMVMPTSGMDAETFAKHFNRRHSDSLSGMEGLPDDGTIQFNIWQLYLSFHYRLHKTRDDFEHEHDPDAPEVAVDRAISCLIENHDFGWKELAGIDGHVAVFPDGQIATRINSAVQHHETVEDATDRLLGTNKL